MLQVIDRSNAHLHNNTLRSFAELRYETFIKQYEWKLPCAEDGFEQDQFDSDDAVYLTVSNTEGQVVGGARLLNMAGRSLLGEVFPHLVDGVMPSSPDVFEITRFVVDRRRERLAGCGDVAAELLWGLQEYGIWARISQFVSVSYINLEPLLRRAGYRFIRMGSPIQIDGTMVAALAHEVTPEVREKARRRVNIEPAVYRQSILSAPAEYEAA